jgi:anti-sigma B factor antagonist
MDDTTAPFSATLAHLNGNAIVVLIGELDLETAAELEWVLGELIQAGRPEVVLDCSALSFMTSSGLTVLIGAQKQLRQQGRHLTLRAPRPVVARVLEIRA